jgi:hypothetical protein
MTATATPGTRCLLMSEEESVQWARNWAAYMLQFTSVQTCLSSPKQMSGLREYADQLRIAFPEVSDSDLGRLLVWMGEFVIKAARRYGTENATPERLMFTFSMTAMELLGLDAGGI